MRRMRMFTAGLWILSLFLLTSCSGFNPVMREHLCNRENYASYTGKIRDIYYLDGRGDRVSLLSSDEIPETDVRIELTFEAYDTVKKFLGGTPNPERPPEDHWFVFEITKENHRILRENGFYDLAASDTPIGIWASSYIYMDSDFFFIAAVTYRNTEYLGFEDGFGNIAAYVDSNRGLF